MAFILCLCMSCGEEAPTAPPPAATTVIVAPSAVTLSALRDTTRLTATVLDQNGQVMTGSLVAYSSSADSVATVDGSGLVTAVGNGTAVVTATSGEASGNATVTVEQKVAEVRVSPDSVTLVAFEDTVRVVADALDANGHEVASAEFAWSSAGSVATVDGAGLVAAVGNGITVVTATSGEASGSATVTVQQRVVAMRVSPDSVTLVAVGDTVRLAAEALDANGHEVASTEFAWSSADSVATVDASGLVTAVGNGIAVVTATCGETYGSATVTVQQRVLAVRVSPDSVTLFAIGDTARLAAEALDANDHAVTRAEFDWSSIDSVMTVDTTGLITAVGNGSAVVTATSGDVSGSATVTVEQRAAEVRVLPESAMLFAIGDTARLTAEARDANGHPVAHGGFDWSSSALGVRVDDSGLVTAVSEGNAVVTATSGEASGSAAVRVTVLTGPARDRAILETFYEATGGPSWTNDDGWLTDARLDNWYGVRTDREGRVVELELIANNLEGHIPAALGRLDRLRNLELSGAPAFGAWCSLTRAGKGAGAGWPESASEVDDYYLRSEVTHSVVDRTPGADDVPPRALASPGASVQGPGNRLIGRIPPELGNLSNLEWLGLGVNELSGPLPPELGKLVKLTKLWLPGNRLTGSLPPELGNLTRLERLVLTVSYDRSLDPRGPRAFLSGQLPPEFGQLVSLRELDLFGHKLTGEVPPEFGKLVQLRILHLACNRTTGTLPSELRQLRDLRFLSLFGNRLDGEFPEWLGELTNLEYVDISGNPSLTGKIPTGIGALTKLVKLFLSENRLSGPIPAGIGRLASLEKLNVAVNRLSGPLPSQIGDLTNLRSLSVFWNAGLTGPLPREIMRTPLEEFYWDGTSLCAPRDRGFQTWLAGIRYQYGAGKCRVTPREVLTAFFEATGGSSWTSNANWLTDAPVSSWFGVTVEDSLVTALELPGNGLSGTLPSAVRDFGDLRRLDLEGNALTGGLPSDLGDLVELEALDLSTNRFSGRLPREIGRLEALERLDLSDNQLEGALPGDFVSLQSLGDLDWSGSGACAPEAAWFQTWLGSVATRSGPTCGGLFSLSVAAAHLSQAAQSIGGAVPLIAGRPALVRILATADRANDLRPNARAGFLLDGREVHMAEMVLGSPRGLAEQLPGRLDQWYHAVIPAELLRPGLEMAVQVDPDSIVPRHPLDDVHVPLDVRQMPPMDLTIVPVVTGSSGDTAVLNWIRSADDSPVRFMRAVLPVGELDLTIREPLTIASAPEAASFDDWLALLEDIALLRATEDGKGYWYGVVNREGDAGIAGIAFVEGRAGAGIPDAEVFAHELGHNMSLTHAPCGFPSGVDPDFPYPDGNIGVLGYDPRSGTMVDPATPDLMSYCRPQWISDYNFAKALEYRIREEAQPRAPAAQVEPGGSRLLLWGRVTADGALHLDPAFALDAPAQRPSRPGPYRVEGFGGDGNRAFALDFDMETVSEGGGGFLFLVPLAEDRIASLERIVLTGPEGSTALDRETRASPVAIVIDRETGRIRSILRGDAAGAAMSAAAVDVSSERERLVVSYGLPQVDPW
ncbi:MAG: Ig-like domain-containing protein [Gemmatimonadota bacterium]|nr:Ig-like domain-containing protein [Gemmatimonadota bacterium]